MPRRAKRKSSLLAPAENLLKRLSSADEAMRRRILRVGLWVTGAVFVYSLMSGSYGIPNMVRLKMQKDALVESNRKLTVELVDAVRIREMLKSDPTYIEKIARTRFRMARPDEIIYRYRGR